MTHLHQIASSDTNRRIYIDNGIDQNLAVEITTIFKAFSKQAICFDIGDIDTLSEVLKNTDFNNQRPPFKECWFECTANLPELDKKSKIGIAFSEYTTQQSFGYQAIFWNKKPNGVWALNGITHINENKEGTAFDIKYEPSSNQTIGNYFKAIINLIFQYCIAISCSNTTLTNHPADKHKNKIRVKKGKLPLYSYKTLVLNIPNDKTIGTAQGGHHASPRVHLRRGHVRTLKNGDTIWINAMTVGDAKKGMIHKDYATTFDKPTLTH